MTVEILKPIIPDVYNRAKALVKRDLFPHKYMGRVIMISGYSQVDPSKCFDCISGDCDLWHEEPDCEDCPKGICDRADHMGGDDSLHDQMREDYW